jgi:16S rRNA processing protein RimM
VANETAFAYTVLAQIVRPQGRHGEVLADLLTDFPERFSDRRELFLLPPGPDQADTPASSELARPAQLEDFWMPQGKSAGRIVLKFAGCNSISDAELLSGLLVVIPQHQRAQLGPDEFFIADLVGCEVFTATGSIGHVESVDLSSAGTPLLVVRATAGEELLLPFVQRFIKSADIPGKRIAMELPPGLLEINQPSPKTAAKPEKTS